MQRKGVASEVKPELVSATEPGGGSAGNGNVDNGVRPGRPRRSPAVWLTLFAILAYCSWAVYYYQFESMPMPLTAEQAGKRGFSEIEAMKHVKALTDFGPHPVGSDALDLAVQYVLAEAEKIKKTANREVNVQVDIFQAKSGANRMVGGLFKGKTLLYSDLHHVVLRISPKYVAEAVDSAILVSSHIDSVFSTGGAGDCSSCIAVMLELARGISQWAHGLKNAVVFLFNTGEEEGLNGAHSFITQHPWSSTIEMAIDLEAMGIGGKSGIFQAGPSPWALENFAIAAKYPSGNAIAQDLFASGAIKSATDFQVYKEIGQLSGIDFAYTDNSAVYHTKNDKIKLLTSGSLQHLGENMLSFLIQTASSKDLSKAQVVKDDEDSSPVYFDILGLYMVLYRQRFATMLHNSVAMQSLLIWTTSLMMGGYPAAVSLALSCLSILLTWIFSITFAVAVAFLLPFLSPSPVPFVANPWLVVGLFAAPALLGALAGQHLGFKILHFFLYNEYSKKRRFSPAIRADLVKLEAERWLYKGGIIQWLILLIVGNYYKIGSCYLAVVWLIPPAFAYGLLEATLTPARFPRPLKLATLLLGLGVPIVVSAGVFIRLAGTIVGMAVRFDRNPGSTPEWMASVIVAVFIALVIALTMVYLLSYVHISGATMSIVVSACVVFGISLIVVLSGISPPFSDDTARAVNVVHVVDVTSSDQAQNPSSYVALFSNTPGKLTREADHMKEGFICGRDKEVDFVSFSVKYGCYAEDSTEDGWSETDVPSMSVTDDIQGDDRTTKVSIDTKSSIRWVLAINTEHVEDFKFEGDSEELIPFDEKSSIDGWHTIQFAGGKNSPTKFNLTLSWARRSPQISGSSPDKKNHSMLLKLRTDFNRLTPKAERVLSKLPSWCSLFGKSTSPYTLAFLRSLPVDL
ncbi:hypothetical protein MLD38_008656 [Melastoma candidum]|uniref:Uncharacterized protein n=1 Tax=Melastoma candidum TaxID=119954 RepID=A0ACB9RY38_9MYRT|nr:hypothetical protein MLD38_008656 [Melastoma candidum]